jgi:isochorismate synthase EntC
VTTEGLWRLFAGAGIVEGSDPAQEWEETAMKFTPVLEALRANGVVLESAVPAST